MEHGLYKSFNISVKRPKVLVIGNGLTRKTSVSWHDLIKGVARDGVDIEHYIKWNTKKEFDGFHLPNTVMTLATSIVEDGTRHNKYSEILSKKAYPSNPQLKSLLEMPFDAVLTTNYTYELESEVYNWYPLLSDSGKRKYAAVTQTERDSKYLLHTFNRIKDNAPDIWHIHGELRCHSSVILSHDEYARLIHEIIDYNKKRADDYRKYENNLKFKSWVDYFLMGDVYILGLSMDFSEFDLWWLLGRRLRERGGCGKCVFYEPEKDDTLYKHDALVDSGVTVKTCGVKIGARGTYEDFYRNAIEDIHNQII